MTLAEALKISQDPIGAYTKERYEAAETLMRARHQLVKEGSPRNPETCTEYDRLLAAENNILCRSRRMTFDEALEVSQDPKPYVGIALGCAVEVINNRLHDLWCTLEEEYGYADATADEANERKLFYKQMDTLFDARARIYTEKNRRGL